jgi:hypothetical protein
MSIFGVGRGGLWKIENPVEHKCEVMCSEYLDPFDWKVRQYVYELFVENERPPQVAEAAAAFQVLPGQIQTAYRRLHESHALTLAPGTFQIRMANPLSAVPTRFRVHANQRSYWANCAWDAFGVPAMLDCDARIER